MDYAKIEEQMKLWRMGAIAFPPEYVEYHRTLAVAGIEELKAAGYTVHKTWLAPDGWMDGMRVTFVIVERQGELKKLRWHDSNSKGRWFQQLAVGGSIPFKIQTPAEDAADAEKMREAAEFFK